MAAYEAADGFGPAVQPTRRALKAYFRAQGFRSQEADEMARDAQRMGGL